jgi:hypothetical protein
MRLRNWEHSASSGLPIPGATVEARAASLVSPNSGTVIASTSTDSNGMWEFVSLPDSATDIKVISGANIWWHKGLTRHNIDELFYNTPTPRTDQFLKNGGFDTATANGAGPWTVTTDVPILDGWRGSSGAGSSAVVSRETTIKSPDSAASAKVVYTKVAGNFSLYQNVAVPAQFRGKTVTLSVQVRQGVANNAILSLGDSAGSTNGTTSATTGSFVTLTVTRTIDAAATSASALLIIQNGDTVYFDDAILNLGAQASTFQPEYWFAGAVGPDQLADGGVTDVKMANQKVNRVGDTMTGTLAVSKAGPTPAAGMFTSAHIQVKTPDGTTNPTVAWWRNGVTAASIYESAARLFFMGSDGVTGQLVTTGTDGAYAKIATGNAFTASNTITINANGGVALTLQNQNTGYGLGILNAAANNWDLLVDHVTATFTVAISGTSATLSGALNAASGAISGALTVGSGGSFGSWSATTLSATTDVTIGGTSVKARSTHTGTQAPSTISPQGSGSALDADTVDGSHASAFATSGHAHAGTYLKLAQGGSKETITFSGGSIEVGQGLSGAFGNGILVVGDFKATGTKSRIATGRDGQQGVLHANESPLPMFEEYGRARTFDGEVTVVIPPDFANYVALSEADYYVLLTAEGNSALYVAARRADHFVVRVADGEPDVSFVWHLIARQGDMTHIERRLPVGEI